MTFKNRDKLLKKFKRSRLHIGKELYNAIRYKDYFENRLNECIGKLKKLWKA